MRGKPRVLIADDHTLVSDAVVTTLENTGRYQTVVSRDFDETIEKFQIEAEFAITLLDLKMPGMVGFETVQKVLNEQKAGKVVLFSGYADPQIVSSALGAGAYGVIPKNVSLLVLPNIISLVETGQIFVPADMQPGQWGRATHEERDLDYGEKEIIAFAARGYTSKETAIELGVSERVVKMGIRRICKKLNARNRTQAVAIALEKSII